MPKKFSIKGKGTVFLKNMLLSLEPLCLILIVTAVSSHPLGDIMDKNSYFATCSSKTEAQIKKF